MTKQEFIVELKKLLYKLPSKESRERLVFYSEMIDDKIDEGLTEENAVASVGTPRDIALQIREEIRLQKKKNIASDKRKLKPYEVCLLILGSPLWIAFLIVGLAVVISIFAVLLALNLALWAIEIPFFVCSLLSHYILIACKVATKLTLLLTKRFLCRLKAFFRGKEQAQK